MSERSPTDPRRAPRPWRDEVASRLAGLKLEAAREAEIIDELSQHLEDRYRELLAAGVVEAEAWRTAIADLSDPEALGQGLRQVETRVEIEPVVPGAGGEKENVMNDLGQDLRYGLRVMVKDRAFTAVAVLTLALGIGANTAIFSVLDAVLLRPLPYPEPQQLVKLWSRFQGIGLPNDQNDLSAPEFHDLQQLSQSFSGIAAISAGTFNLGGKGSPERLAGAAVSPAFFRILGAQALLGRTFVDEEAQPGHDHEAILSYGLWQRGFGGNRTVIGSTIQVDAVPYTVVGVMPAGFDYPQDAQLWGPLAFGPDDLSPNSRGNHGLEVLARIKPGLSFAQARTDMDRVGKTMIEQNRSYPYDKFGFAVIMNSLLEETVGDVKTSLWVLMAAVGLVLLIACANVANLLLVRASGREKEIAVRVALGASPGRLARHLLTESTLLALFGGTVGLIVTPLVLRGLVALSANTLPRVVHTGISGAALAFTLAVSLGTGILFGLAPVLHVLRAGSYDVLKSGRTTAPSASNRLRRGLILGETAVSLVLLAGAGLLLRSFMQVLKVDPGFRPEGVLTMRVSLPDAKYNRPEQVRGFYGELLDRIRALPGVESAGAINFLPLGGLNSSGTTTIETEAVKPEDRTPEVDYRAVTPGYFKAMGISLVRGRYFDGRDSDTAPRVAIVDETLAQTYWPGQDPVGRRLHFGGSMSNPSWLTVIGEVRHVRNRTLEARSRVEFYWPEAQRPQATVSLAVRTSGNPMSLAPTLEREVSALDPELPVFEVRSMAEVMGESVARRRLALILLAVFAGLALLLASIGIYGVSSYSVNQRQQEIGLRMALGARQSQVLRLVLRQGMSLTLVGLGIGLLAALGLTRLISSLLFEVRPADPLALGAAVLLLAAVALLAVLIPAGRAMRVDPAVTLRYE
ncbi:MAG TPA: ABC transporter permease [Terriglobia bacterium]|nr:ABC transporter permease [Terriglobia bacterium]